MFMDRDKVEVHKNAKKERGKYPAIKIRTRAQFQGNLHKLYIINNFIHIYID